MDINFLQSEGLLGICQLDQSQESIVEEALDELSVAKPYTFFDLSMSSEESNLLQTISVEKNVQDFRLNINADSIKGQEFVSGLEGYLHGMSEQNKDISAKAINIIQKQLSSLLGEDKNAQLVVRSELDSQSNFWHKDRSILEEVRGFLDRCPEEYVEGECKEEELWDFVNPYTETISLSLKGAKTVFADMPFDSRKSFYRASTLELPSIVSGVNQATAFIADSEYGAMHSVPIFSTPRVVLLVSLKYEEQSSDLSTYRGYGNRDEHRKACRKASCMIVKPTS
jgi:hypothetical protein